MDPTKYGYEDKNGSLIPTFHINSVSESLVQNSSCKYAHTNTLHAEVLVSLAVFIANVKTTSQVRSV